MNIYEHIILIAISLIFAIVFGIITYKLGTKKFRSSATFFLGFFLGWIGIIIVVMLMKDLDPNKKFKMYRNNPEILEKDLEKIEKMYSDGKITLTEKNLLRKNRMEK